MGRREDRHGSAQSRIGFGGNVAQHGHGMLAIA
jgi:hypothetical protein